MVLLLGIKYSMRNLICDVIILRESRSCDTGHMRKMKPALPLESLRFSHEIHSESIF